MGRIIEIKVKDHVKKIDFAQELIRDGCTVETVKELTGLSPEKINEALENVYVDYFRKEQDAKDKRVAVAVLIKNSKLRSKEIADLIDMPVDEVAIMKEKYDSMTKEEKDRMVIEREVDEIEGDW